MIRTPRNNPSRCPAGCDCRVCRDPLTRWAGRLNEDRPGDRWQAIDLQRQAGVQHHEPGVVPEPDLDGFDAAMQKLIDEVRGGGDRG